MTVSSATAKTLLVRFGFRVNSSSRYKQALRDFQAGWNLGPALSIDGILGPKTSAALLMSEKRRLKGQPTASAHFSFSEFRCSCGGKYAACRRVCGEGRVGHKTHVLRTLIQSLEKTRFSFYPKGLLIVSGYRCDGHNRDVKGASSSQHRFGAAADVTPVVFTGTLRAQKWFAGLGYQGATNKIRHVDRRDISGVNPTRGTTSNPTTWRY